ncbi:AAA family ATPase [Bradyrhizobium sp. JR3.5]
MPLVISVAQRKGGVGKTTLAVLLAAELDRRTGVVGLVDADSQASACHWAEPGNLSFPVYQLDPETRPVAEWARLMRQIPHQIIVVDSAPNDRVLGAVLAVANIVLMPCTPSGLDIEATARTIDIVREVRAARRTALRAMIVPNRVDQRTLEGPAVDRGAGYARRRDRADDRKPLGLCSRRRAGTIGCRFRQRYARGSRDQDARRSRHELVRDRAPAAHDGLD